MKQKKVRKGETSKSYGEMDGKSSDLRDAVFTGRVKIYFLKPYLSTLYILLHSSIAS